MKKGTLKPYLKAKISEIEDREVRSALQAASAYLTDGWLVKIVDHVLMLQKRDKIRIVEKK